MKKSICRMISLLTVLALAVSLTVSAGAESALDTILRTGTTQAFSSDAVPDTDIQKILQAGVSTSSAMNQQPWFFVAITNQDLMKELAGYGSGFNGGPEGYGNPMDGSGSMPGGMPNMPGGMYNNNMPNGVDMPDGANDSMNRQEGFSLMSETFQDGMPMMPGGGNGSNTTLGDSPLAIIVYMKTSSRSSSHLFDCGLATQNMAIAASSLGYGVKIVSSVAMSLNGEKHDEICTRLGVDTGMKAAAVLLIGKPAQDADATSGATTRESLDSKSVIIH